MRLSKLAHRFQKRKQSIQEMRKALPSVLSFRVQGKESTDLS